MKRSPLQHFILPALCAAMVTIPAAPTWAKPRPARTPTARPTARPTTRPQAQPREQTLPNLTKKKPLIVGAIPEQNKARYLGWKGRIDTQIDLDDFFDGDHTIAVWWNPQFPYAYEGPILTSHQGMLAIGQDDYRNGEGGYKDSGDPVFSVRIGNHKALYSLSPTEYRAGHWVHIAVVRRNDVVELWVNGKKRTPVKKVGDSLVPTEPIKLSSSFFNKPSGMLRMGRAPLLRRGGKTPIPSSWQAYGIVDDLAVYDKALGAQQLASLPHHARLNGTEPHLKVGISFDEHESSKIALPMKLRTAFSDNSRAYKVPVSKDRSSKDGHTFENPFIIGETAKAMKLPFKKEEVWRVVQGLGDPAVSHNGYAAFCWDFVLANGTGNTEYPGGSEHAPVYNVATGKIKGYYHEGPVAEREPFKVHVTMAPGEIASYLHLAENQLTSKAKHGVANDKGTYYEIPAHLQPTLHQHEFVGKLGPKAEHLHFGISAGNGKTIPGAFTDYWVSEDKGKTWKKVLRGFPKKGQWIKRMN